MSITDSGVGIPRGRNLFEEETSLARIRAILKLFDGIVDYVSKPERGSTFFFTIEIKEAVVQDIKKYSSLNLNNLSHKS